MFKYFFLMPFVLQACVMAVDEFYCHQKRKLGLWETIGHPIDTLSVIAAYVALFYASKENIPFLYILLSVFSCLLVTKDEWVHAQQCDAFENWLHSILFLVHPLCFVSAWAIWNHEFVFFDILTHKMFLQSSIVGAVVFASYQSLYWGIIFSKPPLTKVQGN